MSCPLQQEASCSAQSDNGSVETFDIDAFNETISPFFFVDHATSCSVCLCVGEYTRNMFRPLLTDPLRDKEKTDEEILQKNGYHVTRVASGFLRSEMCPSLGSAVIQFDSESGMFCAYSSSDPQALRAFVVAFKEACDSQTLGNLLYVDC